MFFKLLVLVVLATASAAPQDAVVAEPVVVEEVVPTVVEEIVPAVVPVVEAAAPVVVTPSEYAINTCRTEAEPLETQTCTPRHERVCIPQEVVNQKIGYEKKCKDIVSIHCPQVGAPIGGTVLVKREADPQFFGAFGPFGPAHLPIHHVRQACQEVTTQHCVDSPIAVDEAGVAESCHVVTKVDCIPHVEHIPRTICDPVETILPGNLTPINPLAYHQGLLFGR